MFRWNIARSAEAVLSRWAVKRLCKFLLKKKLGKFILGDIDLDQLDVQLSDGTIQLCDLALNVEYLNEKLGAAASLIIKEGSIGSLLVKMPWKDKGFQVEVDELEIVLAPCPNIYSVARDVSTSSGQDGKVQCEVGKLGHDVVEHAAKPRTADVHEGVKTIAKMVKWFLTSFHVRVKNLIVAFEPYMEKTEKKVGCTTTLVLRISNTECGTCFSEDTALNSDATDESFLGISQLTNFVEFQGAVVELLHMDDVDNQTCSPCTSNSTFGELFTEHCAENATTSIMTGQKGGFSGNLKLSMPWRNGSLDIRKVDVNVCIDPLVFRLKPSTIKWFLLSWETLNSLNKVDQGNMHYKSTEFVSSNTNVASSFHSSTSFPCMVVTDKLIHDWMPNCARENEKDGIQELDLGASVDQFFECFDEMRNSQSALGSSGMWNWTCSVFSALTAASSLASGSLHIPSEQQHVKTNFKVTLAGFFIKISFQDEDQEHLCDPNGDQGSVGSNIHFLGVQCKDISAGFQICPREVRFEGTVKYIEVTDYKCDVEDAMKLGLTEVITDGNRQTLLIQHLQSEVQGALPPFALLTENPYSDELSALSALEISHGSVIKTKLLSTSGVTCCQFTIPSDMSGPTLFSLQLPRFIFWLNFRLIDMLFGLLMNIKKSIEINSQENGFPSVDDKHGLFRGDVRKGLHHGGATTSSTKNFRGSISIPCARIILCFPFESGKEFGGCSSQSQFIAIDVSTSLALREGEFYCSNPSSGAGSCKKYSSRATQSFQLNLGNLSMYLVNSACDYNGINSSNMPKYKFNAQKILSISNGAGSPFTISLLWQEGPVTGPWIAEKAKSLATSEDSRRGKNNVVGGSEFATLTAVKNLDDTNSQIREEMILSSAFFLHVHLFAVQIDLSTSQYGNLHVLLDQMISELSVMASDLSNVGNDSSASQTSIYVECESVEILIRPDIKENIKISLQSELPGSWYCLKLKIQKFGMLSVSNIGGICGANFFWLAHGAGKLWGSITGVPEEFLLICCSNATRKRGDGGGSNVLSSGIAGSDIVLLWDPRSFHDFISITIRCSTIVAIGGRLDWLDAIFSFFTLPCPEVDKVNDNSFPKGNLNAPRVTSFVLKLVDIGLSYEPRLKHSMIGGLYSESHFSYLNEETGEPYISCLLAASSLTLSNTSVEDNAENYYKIRVQDIGLLLCAAHQNNDGTYSVEYLDEMGYVKVAREALFEAVLRTNCKNGLPWELECSKSHIYVETCQDTTSGLMRLAAQIQQLFAPDLEESIVHLQTRWNYLHQPQEQNTFNNESKVFNGDCPPSTSQVHASSVDTKCKVNVVGLMDEICEDAFHLNKSEVCQVDPIDSEVQVSIDESLLGEFCSLGTEAPDFLSDNLSFDGLLPLIGLERSQTTYVENGNFPEFIEGYCLSELCPSSEISRGKQSSPEISSSKTYGDADFGRGNSGWYGDATLSIVENHVSETNAEANMNQSLEMKPPSTGSAGSNDFEKPTGCVLLKNVDLSWRMYAGSDWHTCTRNVEPSTATFGRNTTVCLELILSGTQFQYNLFPIDGITASKLSFSIQNFYLYDRSKNAPWKLVLGYYHSKDHPRESSSKAMKLELEAVRPDPLIPLEEYRLHLAFLPMLLHLHQNQVDFLISFFGPKNLSSDWDNKQDLDFANPSETKGCSFAGHTIAKEALLPFFQKFDVWPMLLRIDYCPRSVDLAALRGGKYVELINLVPWKGVELQLKHVHAVGVYGWGSICETIMGEWLEDISQNQIRKILRGLPTIRSLFAVGAGAAKLISSPVESYRKDQRVLKGMQRGTAAFLRSISLEAVALGVHLTAGAHDILLQAEYWLTSSIPSSISCPAQGKKKSNVRCNQPKDAQQGIQQACENLSDGLGKSATALVRTPLKKYQRGASARYSLATAVRAVPAAVIAPVSACAGAAHCALLGIRNSLDPEHKKESMEKYLGPSQQGD